MAKFEKCKFRNRCGTDLFVSAAFICVIISGKVSFPTDEIFFLLNGLL